MREIKFRAWDKKEKKMYPILGIANQAIACGGQIYNEMIESCDFEVMQYIGLKDKNGKEIYDSDLLRIKFLANPDNKMKKWRYKVDAVYKVTITEFSLCVSLVKLYQPDLLITHIYFRDEDFRNEGNGILKIDSKYESGKKVRPICDVEVIGNIYENPELLKYHD